MDGQKRPVQVTVMGIPIAPVRMGEAAAWVAAWVQSRAGKAVFTVNPEIVMLAGRDDEFARILRDSDLNLADGIGVVLAAGLAGVPIPERVAGADLVEHLGQIGGSLGWSIFFLGGRECVACRAGEALVQRHPSLRVAGWSEADSGEAADDETIAAINAVNTDLLLVAFGAPGQERWIARNLKSLNVGVAIGVGGTFDFLAGDVPRAPARMRAVGLEWLYRLLVQPSRWRRMLALPAFAAAAVRWALAGRR
jgi:N-acetylglucosaminyldiphosphoundecaprenol N-acetyl-beta-D-mannosaminyltransferase